MKTLKAALFCIAMTFSCLSYAACPSTQESEKAISAYLALDVQKSLEMANFIMSSIQEVKATVGHAPVSVLGNVYVLTIFSDTVEIETGYGSPNNTEIVTTTHSLCEFEARLAQYIEMLSK